MGFTKERWEDIEGFKESYQVSDLGRVRSLDRLIWNGKVYYKMKGRVLKTANDRGYLYVNLMKSGNGDTRKVHRLVAETFILKVKNKPTVNHKDLDKSNNRVDNLEWLSNNENIQHAKELGVFKKK